MLDRIMAIAPVQPTEPAASAAGPGATFAQTLLNGLNATNDKLVSADKLVKAFATQGPDGDIPIHQVAYAIESARMDFELDLQVRTKLLDAYQQFMAMQI